MDLLIKHRVLEGMNEDEFYELCVQNRDLKFERNADRHILVMSPTSSLSGSFNSEIDYQLQRWNKEKKLGICFDSSAGFTLPNGAVRSPDASFIFLARWNNLSTKDKKGFARICPDFIIELMSETDTIQNITLKMEEYLINGCRLGWIIQPDEKRVHIFQPDRQVEIVQGFDRSVSASEVLPEFALDLRELRTV